MRKVKIACVQMSCTDDRQENIDRALAFSQQAADNGADIVLLPELFERKYFCQERNYDYYAFAEEPNNNLAVKAFKQFTKKTETVAIVSFYEKCSNVLFNSAMVIESGKSLGVYRKSHIPDDHFYQEKFYFTPGDSGFKTFKTARGVIGVGICWDQWFPETARSLALNGAEIIFFPTAIGSEPILGSDSSAHWRRVMCGHAAANLVPVAAANRVGEEVVLPTAENANQSSSLTFYGSSFITDNLGEVISSADRTEQTVIYAEYDLDELEKARLEWGLFRDRRPLVYKDIVKK